MIQYLLVLSLSNAMAINFGCFNHSQIEMTSNNISRAFLSSVDHQLCYNRSYFSSAVVFNYYHQNRVCELLYNYSFTYRIIKNNDSQMCVLQLPDSQKAGLSTFLCASVKRRFYIKIFESSFSSPHRSNVMLYS